jgi:3-dehydroquinate synthetase
MTSSTWQIKEAVQRVLDDLPAEKIEEVLDFALFLKARWTAQGESKTTVPESTALILHTLPAAHLDRLTGLVAWGGDAVADAERLYDDHS